MHAILHFNVGWGSGTGARAAAAIQNILLGGSIASAHSASSGTLLNPSLCTLAANAADAWSLDASGLIYAPCDTTAGVNKYVKITGGASAGQVSVGTSKINAVNGTAGNTLLDRIVLSESTYYDSIVTATQPLKVHIYATKRCILISAYNPNGIAKTTIMSEFSYEDFPYMDSATNDYLPFVVCNGSFSPFLLKTPQAHPWTIPAVSVSQSSYVTSTLVSAGWKVGNKTVFGSSSSPLLQMHAEQFDVNGVYTEALIPFGVSYGTNSLLAGGITDKSGIYLYPGTGKYDTSPSSIPDGANVVVNGNKYIILTHFAVPYI